MRILLTLLCSVMLWSSTCVAATFTTKTETFTRDDYTLTVEYPEIDLGDQRANGIVGDIIDIDTNAIRRTFLSNKGDNAFDGGRRYYTVTYNGDKYISLIRTTVKEHEGAAHPEVSAFGRIIDAETGYGVVFEDLYNNGKINADVSGLVENGIYHYNDNTPYTGNLIGSVNRKCQDAYVNEEGMLCLFFSPYSIAPWSEGFLYIPVCPVNDFVRIGEGIHTVYRRKD